MSNSQQEKWTSESQMMKRDTLKGDEKYIGMLIFLSCYVKKKVEAFRYWKAYIMKWKIQNQNLWVAVNTVPKGKIIAYMFIRKEKLLMTNLNRSSENDKSWGQCNWKWQWRK